MNISCGMAINSSVIFADTAQNTLQLLSSAYLLLLQTIKNNNMKNQCCLMKSHNTYCKDHENGNNVRN